MGKRKPVAKGNPPRPEKFEKNEEYEFRRGFAFKLPVDVANKRFKLGLKGQGLVWVAPDGSRILSDKEANQQNSRRRSTRTISDSWADFKSLSPEAASRIGWNQFGKDLRGIHGSRVKALQRIKDRFGLTESEFEGLENASQAEPDQDKGGWGDSK